MTRLLVSDVSERYTLREYLTETDDLEAFGRRAGPASRVTPVSEEEYRRLLSEEDIWDDPCVRYLARCLRREGIYVRPLDRETVGRIMRIVRDALAWADVDEPSK